jgi:hypothetical protein
MIPLLRRATLPVITATALMTCSGHPEGDEEVVAVPSDPALAVELATGAVEHLDSRPGTDGDARWRDPRVLLRPLAGNADTRLWIGSFETTRAQWLRAAPGRPWATAIPTSLFATGEEGGLPVAGVSADDAEDWIMAVQARLPAGYRVRLPTMDEWRLACLAGGSGPYSWGSSTASTVAAVHAVVRETAPSLRPVGSRAANRGGCYDLHGNVMEWTTVPGGSPVLLGGSWFHHLLLAGTDQEVVFDPAVDYGFAGFRIVIEEDMGL